MRDEALFWEYDWFAVVEAQKAAIRRDAENMSKADFARQPLDELQADLCEKYSLEVPALDLDNITIKQRETDIDVSHDRMRYFSTGGPHYIKGTAIDVRVPFVGDPGMFKIKPTTWTTSLPRGRIEGSSVRFTISGTDLSPEKVKSEIDHRINEIQQWLGFQEQSIGNFPTELAQIAKQALEARIKKLESDSELIAGLGYRTE
jgi:uncharacterized coiled-coil protein SlyX